MKKKKTQHSVSVTSGESSPWQQSADYTVGQVSGSLSQQNSGASGSLSALFRTSTQAAPILFQPAPKVKSQQKSSQDTEGLLEDSSGFLKLHLKEPQYFWNNVLQTDEKVITKEDKQESSCEVKEEQSPKKKLLIRKTSAADQKLQSRESSLQNADEEEHGQQSAAAKRKRRDSRADRENDVEYWVMRRQQQKARKQEEAFKSKRTVFVGNLPISCTEKTLRRLFKHQGAIESVRFRSVVREDPCMSRKVAVIKRKAHPQKQSLNAYVLFKSVDAVAKALERNGLEMEPDFHIRVDRVTDSCSHDHKRSVFLGNLPFEIKELEIRNHFEKCGPVEAVRLVRDKNSGLGKGFGYVLFEHVDSVQLALELDDSKLQGRSIRVKRSVKKEKQERQAGSRGTSARPSRTFRKRPGQEKEAGPGESSKRFSRNQQRSTKSHSSFKGEMVDPNKKNKKKVLKKKKVRANKRVHT